MARTKDSSGSGNLLVSNGEQPESQLNLGGIYTDMRQYGKAEQSYRKALRLQPVFVPAYINFSQMLSNRGREVEAANLLQSGIKHVPLSLSAVLYHALGLSQVRQKNTREAIQSLAKAAELDVDNRRYQYVYALALQSVGKLDQAMNILRRTHERHPSDADILYALITFNRDAGKREDALVYARKLQTLIPDNPAFEQLVEALTKP